MVMDASTAIIDQDPSPPASERVFTADEIEDADFRAVAQPTNFLTLPENCTRGLLIEHLARTIPQNEYGLPLYYLRSDLLDVGRYCHLGHITQDEADGSAELLSYTDGYPTFKSGSPFWTQMPHEPHQSYILFQQFLELAESEGIRLVDTLSKQEQVPLDSIREAYMEFFWSARARAYDLFIVAAEAKKREHRTRKAENHHYTKAGEFLDKITNLLTDEKLEQMDGKQLLDAMDQMVKIQRLSLGLTGQHASSVDPTMKTQGASVEVLFRQLTKNTGLSETGEQNLQNRLSLLMSDESTAMQVQELIVKATSAS